MQTWNTQPFVEKEQYGKKSKKSKKSTSKKKKVKK